MIFINYHYKLLLIRTNFEGPQEFVLKGVHCFTVLRYQKDKYIKFNVILDLFSIQNTAFLKTISLVTFLPCFNVKP